ncbi:MAG: cytochrome P450 [Steroidobacteraceae bacterium]
MAGKNPVIPSHVPQTLVRDIDIYSPPGADEDYHLAMKRIQDSAPDIFWSPYQGGHWVSVRCEDMYEEFFPRYEIYSSSILSVPKEESLPYKLLPIESDPPAHTAYRALISPWFTPKAIGDLEVKARELTIGLVEGFKDRGECEFITEFSQHLPIAIFMSLVDLPWQDRELLMGLAERQVYQKSHEDRLDSLRQMQGYLAGKLADRRRSKGSDMLSKIATATIDGRPLSDVEQTGMATLVLIGGLDTVASMLGFVAAFLARNPTHRRQLVEDPTLIPGAVEELIRRHGVAQPSRLLVKDHEYKGVRFKTGDQIVLSTMMSGLDERAFPDPMKVDFRRKVSTHAIFGNGPHRCPGSFLARTEIKVYLQEWLRRIPDFEIKPEDRPIVRAGINGSYCRLPLSWKVA